MNNKLPKNSKGIAHLGVLALLGVLVTSAVVIIIVRRNDSGGVDNIRMPQDEQDQVVDDGDSGEDAEDRDDNERNDEDSGSYTVYFNDDCIKGTQGESQPMTMEICISDAWAQTCDGLYSNWVGTSHNKSTLSTSAGEDVREGDGEFSFTLNKLSPQLSEDKKTITIEHWMQCPYCEDPTLELTGKVIKGAKEACN